MRRLINEEGEELELAIIDISILHSLDSKLDESLERLKRLERNILMDLTALQNEVANNTTVEQSAITLIQGLAAQIQAAGTDPAALQAVVDTLQANDSALAAAVTANTVSAQEPDATGVSGGTDVSAAAAAANAAASDQSGAPVQSPQTPADDGLSGGTDVTESADAANQPTGTNAPSPTGQETQDASALPVVDDGNQPPS